MFFPQILHFFRKLSIPRKFLGRLNFRKKLDRPTIFLGRLNLFRKKSMFFSNVSFFFLKCYMFFSNCTFFRKLNLPRKFLGGSIFEKMGRPQEFPWEAHFLFRKLSLPRQLLGMIHFFSKIEPPRHFLGRFSFRKNAQFEKKCNI